MNKPLERAFLGLQVGWESPGNHQGGENSVSQVDGESDIALTCWLCEGMAQQRNKGCCQHFCLGETCPSTVA